MRVVPDARFPELSLCALRGDRHSVLRVTQHDKAQIKDLSISNPWGTNKLLASHLGAEILAEKPHGMVLESTCDHANVVWGT